MGFPCGQVVGSSSVRDDRQLDGRADHVFPLACFVVRFGPREAEHVGEEAFGQAVTAHHRRGELATCDGEADFVLGDRDQAVVHEPSHHLGYGGPGHLEPLGDPGLDHPLAILVQLEDGLAVLLECRVVLG